MQLVYPTIDNNLDKATMIDSGIKREILAVVKVTPVVLDSGRHLIQNRLEYDLDDSRIFRTE